MKQKLLSLGLSLALVLGLAAGCAPKAGPEESPAPETSSPVAETPPAETVAPYQTIRLGLLNGPTGMGAAKLLADSDAAFAQAEEGTYDTTEGTFFHYELTLGSDPSTDIVPKLNNGELDIAAVPTNLAATLYNKAGSIRLLALNTLGVLHILENGDTVHSMADLAGKTIYSINQGTNTEYVLNYLLEESGLTPGEDVTIEWKTSEEVTALMASGGIDLCMLPVPAATSVMMQNADVRDAIDLNDVWQDVGAAGTFTMGCVVARSDFVEEHPEAVDAFLTEYAASIAYVNEHPEEAAALVEQYGIVPKAAVAKAAIPQANMVCLTGDELKGISDYYEVLYAADPTSIGGAIPDDNFYYIPQSNHTKNTARCRAPGLLAGGLAACGHLGGHSIYPRTWGPAPALSPAGVGAAGRPGRPALLLADSGGEPGPHLRRLRPGGGGGHPVGRHYLRPLLGGLAVPAHGEGDPRRAGGLLHRAGAPVGLHGAGARHRLGADGAAGAVGQCL